MTSSTYILRPGTRLDLRLCDTKLVEHTFITQFDIPINCVAATRWVLDIIHLSLDDTLEEVERSVGQEVHNTFVMLYQKQQKEMLPPEDGPDMLHD